jgi:endonuclease III
MTANYKPRSQLAPSQERVKKIIARLEKAHPDARLALDFTNSLELLVSLILAAQSHDSLVTQITPALFAKYHTAQDYADAPLEQLEDEIRRINFSRMKSRRIKECCKAIVRSFKSEVPSDFDDLLTLPGVGRKTANVLLGNSFGQQTIGVDTHVGRLSQRLGLTRNTDPDKIEADLMPVVPEDKRVRFCHLLQYHGRRICLARKPRCPVCVISELCPYPDKTPPERFK